MSGAPGRVVLRSLLGAWRFATGDDWRTAAGVLGAIALTAIVAAAGFPAWWVMPVAVAALLGLSLRRAARGR